MDVAVLAFAAPRTGSGQPPASGEGAGSDGGGGGFAADLSRLGGGTSEPPDDSGGSDGGSPPGRRAPPTTTLEQDLSAGASLAAKALPERAGSPEVAPALPESGADGVAKAAPPAGPLSSAGPAPAGDGTRRDPSTPPAGGIATLAPAAPATPADPTGGSAQGAGGIAPAMKPGSGDRGTGDPAEPPREARRGETPPAGNTDTGLLVQGRPASAGTPVAAPAPLTPRASEGPARPSPPTQELRAAPSPATAAVMRSVNQGTTAERPATPPARAEVGPIPQAVERPRPEDTLPRSMSAEARPTDRGGRGLLGDSRDPRATPAATASQPAGIALPQVSEAGTGPTPSLGIAERQGPDSRVERHSADPGPSLSTGASPGAQASLPRADAATPVAITTQPAATAETGRAVAPQIASAVAGQPVPGRIELLLDPPELGRIEIGLDISDNGLRATIAAERPATGDLLRRNLEILAQQLSEAGFAEIDLSFAEGQARQRRERDAPPPAEPSAFAPDPERRQGPSASSDRIDLRF